jgi:hypothetical protein
MATTLIVQHPSLCLYEQAGGGGGGELEEGGAMVRRGWRVEKTRGLRIAGRGTCGRGYKSCENKQKWGAARHYGVPSS